MGGLGGGRLGRDGYVLTRGAGPAAQRVVAPVAGGPAYRAGLRPGDALTAVDGQPLAGRSVFEAATQLQGPEGRRVRARGGGGWESAEANRRLARFFSSFVFRSLSSLSVSPFS